MPRITTLKRLIVDRRIIQADLAADAFMNETRLSRIVNKRVRPTDFEIKNLAAALGVSRQELPI
jgi:DNA-binding Xre family transcriptional regulator